MTTVELLLQALNMETGMTRPLLDRVPVDRPDWTPHPKSMPLGKLTMHVATLPRLATLCLSTDSFDIATWKGPDLKLQSHDHLLATFDENVTAARAALISSSDEQLSAPWRFSFGERIISENPRALTVIHMFLGHMIHHRAQLGTYLRLLDVPVPGVYGPSADEPFQA